MTIKSRRSSKQSWDKQNVFIPGESRESALPKNISLVPWRRRASVRYRSCDPVRRRAAHLHFSKGLRRIRTALRASAVRAAARLRNFRFGPHTKLTNQTHTHTQRYYFCGRRRAVFTREPAPPQPTQSSTASSRLALERPSAAHSARPWSRSQPPEPLRHDSPPLLLTAVSPKSALSFHSAAANSSPCKSVPVSRSVFIVCTFRAVVLTQGFFGRVFTVFIYMCL